MNEATFLSEYADERLLHWWDHTKPELQKQMLELITKLHATALAQLDQYTVDEYTEQPDDWKDARLVFAIKEDTSGKTRANPGSVYLRVALNLQKITVVFVAGRKKQGPNRNILRFVTVDQLLPFLEVYLSMQSLIDERKQRKPVEGSPDARAVHWPRDYKQSTG